MPFSFKIERVSEDLVTPNNNSRNHDLTGKKDMVWFLIFLLYYFLGMGSYPYVRFKKHRQASWIPLAITSVFIAINREG